MDDFVNIEVMLSQLERASAGYVVVDLPDGCGTIAGFVDGVCGQSDVLTARSQRAGTDVLVPQTGSSAHRRSLSATYGLGSFPFHTDGAHWITPPRVVILACVEDETGRPTRLVHWKTLSRQAEIEGDVRGAVFRVRNGRYSFYAQALSAERDWFRYDPGCMQPANREAYRVSERLLETGGAVSCIDVHWRPGRVVAFNNHQMLHGRGEAMREGKRQLIRASIA